MRFPVSVTLFAMLVITGCNKTRTCECTRTNLATGATTTDTYTVKTKKKTVKEACMDYQSADSFEQVTCKIK